LQGLLYEVTPTDLATLIAVSGFLIVVAALATLIPARTSTRIDPMVALRTE
jgi:putative ABC transport system permease protein